VEKIGVLKDIGKAKVGKEKAKSREVGGNSFTMLLGTWLER
jgi:hypothetical protein